MPSPQNADALFGVLGMMPVTLKKPELPRYGRLQILGDAPRGKNSARMVWTLCDCGNRQIQGRWPIEEGLIVSCGCRKAEFLQALASASAHVAMPGQRYGRLVVLRDGESRVSPAGYVTRQVLCQCDCGNVSLFTPSKLSRGITKSCGCLRTRPTVALTPPPTVAD